MVNVLLERYVNDEGLGDAFNKITAAWQRPQETEKELGIRLKSYAGRCPGDFNQQLLVNYLLLKLLPTTAAFVAAQV